MKLIDLYTKIFAELKEKKECVSFQEYKQKALIELADIHRKYLDLYVIEISPFGYFLAYYIGELEGAGLFYKEIEDPLFRILEKGKFYKGVISKENSVPIVKLVKKFNCKEIKKIIHLLEGNLTRKKPPEMRVPLGFYVFGFQVRWSLKETESPGSKILIYRTEFLDEAISKFKIDLKKVSGEFFGNFRIFYNNRWSILETKPKGWISKHKISTVSFNVVR